MKETRYRKDGFLSYLTEGVVTPGFLEETHKVCSIIYGYFRLKVSLDEFQSRARVLIFEILPFFKSEKGSINDYLYTVILNLARTINSETFLETSGEILDETGTIFEYMFSSSFQDTLKNDLDIRVSILSFSKKAFNLGIYVDSSKLYMSILNRNYTPAMKSFLLYHRREYLKEN